MNDVYRCTTCDGDWYEQKVRLLTAKDGQPIELHDTVYGEDGKRWRIVGIGEQYVWGQRVEKSGQKRLKPEWLTHEEPDSWERILGDAMGKSVTKYCTERGLSERIPIEGFYCLMMRDLVRRCEALAVQHG